MISRHPTNSLLLAHAAGTLPEPQRVVLRTHLAMCGACGGSAHLASELCGCLLEQMPPAALGPEALEHTLARLDLQDFANRPRPVPTTVAALATGRWRWLGPGLRMMALQRRDHCDARLDLLRIAPGVRLPEHGHTGTELTCVLQGGFQDRFGEYHVGDIAEGDETIQHQPIALDLPEDCICLAATTGRLRAHGLLARLIQPLLGV